MKEGIIAGVVLPLLTAWWSVGVWRHFVQPPKGANFDWGMTHGNLLGWGTIILLGLWAALGRIVWRT